MVGGGCSNLGCIFFDAFTSNADALVNSGLVPANGDRNASVFSAGQRIGDEPLDALDRCFDVGLLLF